MAAKTGARASSSAAPSRPLGRGAASAARAERDQPAPVGQPETTDTTTDAKPTSARRRPLSLVLSSGVFKSYSPAQRLSFTHSVGRPENYQTEIVLRNAVRRAARQYRA